MSFSSQRFARLGTGLCVTAVLTVLAACGDSGGPVAPLMDGLSNAASGTPGEIVKSEPVQLFVTPGVPFPGTSQHIQYRSLDHNGKSVIVTGTVTTPLTPWTGTGKRPIVSFAIGTHGIGDGCAPSFMMSQGTDFEAAVVPALLALGYGVVITDYIGVGAGSEKPASYINRLAEGHAVLDALRAAQRLPAANLPADGPVASFGFSQGGEGSAAAIELQPRYAPELQFVGGYAGGIPSDQLAVLDQIDGGPYAGFMGNFINGLDAAFPDNHLYDQLNAAGRDFAATTFNECVPLVLAPHALVQSSSLFTDGRSLSAHLRDGIWQSPLAAQATGQAKPSAPVLVTQSIADDVVPDASTREAARRWCALGATVEFRVIPVPSHFPAGAASHVVGGTWLMDRFNGTPATNSCGSF